MPTIRSQTYLYPGVPSGSRTERAGTTGHTGLHLRSFPTSPHHGLPSRKPHQEGGARVVSPLGLAPWSCQNLTSLPK